MLIGHGGRGSGQAAQGHLCCQVQAGLPGVAVEAHLPLPRRPGLLLPLLASPRGRGHPDTSAAGGVPCACGQEEWRLSVSPLISRAQGTARQPAPP